MIQYGVIADYRYMSHGNGKILEVKVSVADRTTNWLPVKTKASSFLVEHTPVRVNDQVIVFNPFGDQEDGFVDTNLVYESIPLPNEANENTIVRKVEDGTTYIHDIKNKKITLETPCSIDLVADQDILIHTKKNLTLKAAKIDFKKA